MQVIPGYYVKFCYITMMSTQSWRLLCPDVLYAFNQDISAWNVSNVETRAQSIVEIMGFDDDGSNKRQRT